MRSLSYLLSTACIPARWMQSSGVLILMYHRVLPGGAPSDWPLKSLVVDSDEFAQQVSWLADRFEMCTAMEAVCNGHHGSRPRAAITFDDGYRDNYLYAAPVLREHGVRATFFVTSGFIGCRRRMWFETAAAAWSGLRSAGNEMSLSDWMLKLKRLPVAARDAEIEKRTRAGDWVSPERDAAMSWSEVLELQKAGHEIGCHSRSHPILTPLADDDLRDEIHGSLTDLREHGIQASGIAYPNGDFDQRVISVSREAGLKYGVSTRMGWHAAGSERFSVRRVDVNPALTGRWSDDAAKGLAAEIAWRRLAVAPS